MVVRTGWIARLLDDGWRPLRAAFGFLTRVPGGSATTEGELARSVLFFPVVGLALGLGCAGIGWLHLAGLAPASIVAGGVVVFLALVTGGLHLDGVADLFDGLAGGRGDKERTLRIMRDSRVGAAGALALVLVVLLQLAALRELLERRALLPLVAFPLVARWAVIPQLAFFRYARPAGLGRVFQGRVALTPLAAESILLVTCSLRLGHGLVVQLAAAVGISLGLGLWLQHRLGGLTGDIYGATISLSETAALLVATIQIWP